jgi:hypothetical protein
MPEAKPSAALSRFLYELGCSDDEIARWRTSKVL